MENERQPNSGQYQSTNPAYSQPRPTQNNSAHFMQSRTSQTYPAQQHDKVSPPTGTYAQQPATQQRSAYTQSAQQTQSTTQHSRSTTPQSIIVNNNTPLPEKESPNRYLFGFFTAIFLNIIGYIIGMIIYRNDHHQHHTFLWVGLGE